MNDIGSKGLEDRKVNIAVDAAATVPCSSIDTLALWTTSSKDISFPPVRALKLEVFLKRSPTPMASKIYRSKQELPELFGIYIIWF